MTCPSRMVPLPTTQVAVCYDFVYSERGTDRGCICPVCGTYNKVKKYKLMQQHFDIMGVLAASRAPVHCREFTTDGQAYNKMLNVPKHYGFIAQDGGSVDQPFNRSGRWLITDRGRLFIFNQLRVPAYFWGIHDSVLWWAEPLLSLAAMRERLRHQTYKTMIEEMAASAVTVDTRRGGWADVPNVAR